MRGMGMHGKNMDMQSMDGQGMGMGMGGMKRMHMMGRMGGSSPMEPAAVMSSLPGFPGASHIYHIGASGYFLDHASLARLSKEQHGRLARIQEQSSLEQADFDRRIDQAEQDLWVLTSAGEPDARAIEEKVREIADLSAKQRLAFIQSVGKAAEVLTDDQRNLLVGDHEAIHPQNDSATESQHQH